MNDIIMLGLLGIGVAALILLPGWRWALASLCACGATRVMFGQRELAALVDERSTTVMLLVAIDIAMLVCMALIMLSTGLLYSRQPAEVAPDEIAQMELRRAARRATHLATPRGRDAYALPLLGCVLTALGTSILPWWYPTLADASTYAWTALMLGGAFAAATSTTLHKLGMSLAAFAFGIGLCYLRQSPEVRLFDLVLLNLVPVVLALVTASLCSLMFGRVGTLRLAALWKYPAADSQTKHATPRPGRVADEAR